MAMTAEDIEALEPVEEAAEPSPFSFSTADMLREINKASPTAASSYLAAVGDVERRTLAANRTISGVELREGVKIVAETRFESPKILSRDEWMELRYPEEYAKDLVSPRVKDKIIRGYALYREMISTGLQDRLKVEQIRRQQALTGQAQRANQPGAGKPPTSMEAAFAGRYNADPSLINDEKFWRDYRLATGKESSDQQYADWKRKEEVKAGHRRDQATHVAGLKGGPDAKPAGQLTPKDAGELITRAAEWPSSAGVDVTPEAEEYAKTYMTMRRRMTSQQKASVSAEFTKKFWGKKTQKEREAILVRLTKSAMYPEWNPDEEGWFTDTDATAPTTDQLYERGERLELVRALFELLGRSQQAIDALDATWTRGMRASPGDLEGYRRSQQQERSQVNPLGVSYERSAP